jgi:periplasmic divalent cation tolerance protein
MTAAIIYITADTDETARKITDGLLENRMAACVNIVPGLESHYWWQGKIETAQERLLIVKTRQELLADATALVKKLHPYSVPEVIAVPVTGGSPDYLRWVQDETGLK